ncbi:hypothetical protein BOTBODRAFT_37728, partial [Botryobasidium botryosum FD-172 SS1]
MNIFSRTSAIPLCARLVLVLQALASCGSLNSFNANSVPGAVTKIALQYSLPGTRITFCFEFAAPHTRRDSSSVEGCQPDSSELPDLGFQTLERLDSHLDIMATFAKSTYNASTYASFRPTYPPRLFQAVYDYHARTPRAGWAKAVDLGCGTGQATTVLAERFQHVIGVDPSQKMITQAQSQSQAPSSPSSEPGSAVVAARDVGSLNYRVGNAEELSFLEDESVDLITAGQAAHWFKYDELWPELARVLKRGGSIAFWGYSEFRLPAHPHLTPQITLYSATPSNPAGVGAYWEQPGRSIVEAHLTAVRPPPSLFASQERIHFAGAHDLGNAGKEVDGDRIRVEEAILSKRFTWESMEGYLRTWSSFHAYVQAHPTPSADANAQENSDSEGGDAVTRFLDVLKKGTGEGVQELELEWPLTLVLAKKA